MKMNDLKIGKCIQCNEDMVVHNKTQRFCSGPCRDKWWNKERAPILKAKRAGKKRDLFGFEIAAE